MMAGPQIISSIIFVTRETGAVKVSPNRLGDLSGELPGFLSVRH